ncbi:MAG TPA: long-chain fatty acid--CoA ligase, partial [Myxococcota bacterium]|nr:long-chain fatty acid--CoA ligase [Myxococcota bacterium]
PFDEPLPQGSASASFRSVPDMWVWRVDSTPHSPALSWPTGGGWSSMTWLEADRRVRAIACGLLSLGLRSEDRAAIFAGTSVAWILSDLGILLAGGATTTLHASTPEHELRHVLTDSGARVIFVDGEAALRRVLALRADLPALRHVILLEGAARDGAVTLAQLEAQGEAWSAEHPGALDAVRTALRPNHLATLIYTSGTTGLPKGVELSHDAWVYEAEAIDKLGLVNAADKQVLFLPLAHVFAKVMVVVLIRLGVPTAVVGRPDRLMGALPQLGPTWMACVPRFLEKVHNDIRRQAREEGIAAWLTFRWALDVGRRVSALRQRREQPTGLLRLEHAVAHRLVFRAIHERFGGRLRFMISGGAPLSKEIAEFFHAIGVTVCEGYGLTESAAASCVNTPEDVVFGTVGRPLPGCEVRVAEDGEILLRSRGVMRGYHNLPEATAEALDADGWLHTGDIGRLLETGHLEITDRKKDLIITANGKNVAPAHFQGALLARSKWVSHVLLVGDRRPFCSALVTLAPDELERWAREEKIRYTSVTELTQRPEVQLQIQQAIDDVNRELAPWERARRFAILPEDFTIENGLLTPTLKPRRRLIEDRYRATLEGFYHGALEG